MTAFASAGCLALKRGVPTTAPKLRILHALGRVADRLSASRRSISKSGVPSALFARLDQDLVMVPETVGFTSAVWRPATLAAAIHGDDDRPRSAAAST